jgi:ABC-2 type transport system permease protein
VNGLNLPPARCRLPGTMTVTWLIARRAALEALQDRLSLLVGLFFALVVPLGLLVLVVLPSSVPGGPGPELAARLASNLLVVGILPAFSAVGVAAGQFAGEKERGLLTPLLATPASNGAIFAGKVLGAVIPSLAYAALADATYLVGASLLLGPANVGLLSPGATVATVLLVPAVTCFAAVMASLISSRVRTFNAAQQLGGLVLTPVWAAVLALATWLHVWGSPALFGVVGALFVLDVALAALAAATWRREEVLARR